jgi:hypothetical protein
MGAPITDPTAYHSQAKVSSDMGAPVTDPIAYHSLAGALQYLTFTRFNISYMVQQVCLHMHDPCEPHLIVVKCILRDLQGTLEHSLHRASTSELVVYTDVV